MTFVKATAVELPLQCHHHRWRLPPALQPPSPAALHCPWPLPGPHWPPAVSCQPSALRQHSKSSKSRHDKHQDLPLQSQLGHVQPADALCRVWAILRHLQEAMPCWHQQAQVCRQRTRVRSLPPSPQAMTWLVEMPRCCTSCCSPAHLSPPGGTSSSMLGTACITSAPSPVPCSCTISISSRRGCL